MHDFEFLVGDWNVRHQRLKERLTGCTEWEEFDGTSTLRICLDGQMTFDENVIHLPSGTYRAATVRAFDPATQQWAIWWIDGRTPHNPLDPPMKGRFDNGVGTFLADETLRGQPIKVRFIWSDTASPHPRWEQAFSPDGGKTWEVNWVMRFSRA